MPWIPEKYEPERPDFEYLRKRAEGGFGAHPNQVLWMLDMLEEACTHIEYSDEWLDDEKRDWLQKYEGYNKDG